MVFFFVVVWDCSWDTERKGSARSTRMISHLDRKRYVSIKKLEFQRYPPRYFCAARYEHESWKKKFRTFQNPEKIIPRPILGQDRPENNSSQMFVRSGGIPSPGQTSIDKTNDCAMKSDRGALVRGSDPPSGHSVHKTTGDTWRAPARRLIQTYLGAAV